MKLGITIGDACGIGPEVILKALDLLGAPDDISVYGNRAVLAEQAKHFGFPTPKHIVDIEVESLPTLADFGTQQASAARLQFMAFDRAMNDASSGKIQGIVTAPWTKSLMSTINLPVVGHTELLAERFDPQNRHVMMLAGPRLRVSLVTTHIPISEVAKRVTHERILQVIRTTAEELQRSFGIANPHIAVCGLNPHAGEQGHIGMEDERVTKPAIADAKRLGIHVSGPFPSDTLFPKFVKDTPFDAVVAMYHDQGLVPLKTIHFGEAVNITLGIAILRTSVDHGSAYDIAGQNIADPASLIHAIECAREMAKHRAAPPK